MHHRISQGAAQSSSGGGRGASNQPRCAIGGSRIELLNVFVGDEVDAVESRTRRRLKQRLRFATPASELVLSFLPSGNCLKSWFGKRNLLFHPSLNHLVCPNSTPRCCRNLDWCGKVTASNHTVDGGGGHRGLRSNLLASEEPFYSVHNSFSLGPIGRQLHKGITGREAVNSLRWFQRDNFWILNFSK